ncbi:acyl-CoA thioesterase II [Bradyrhizobium sp. 14AA]
MIEALSREPIQKFGETFKVQSKAVPLSQMLDVLVPEQTEADQFRGHSLDWGMPYVFGGQFVAQALAAAELTVRKDQSAHSMHGYFLRAGDASKPVIYQVDRLRDGKSFATRRVDAMQDGRAIFTLTASFQCEEAAFEHQDLKPKVPGPENLLSHREVVRKYVDRTPGAIGRDLWIESAIEVRPVGLDDILTREAKPPLHRVWCRAVDKLPCSPALHRYLLALLSDVQLMSVAMQPHALTWDTPGLQATSLDHAIWFHRPFRMDEWLLHVMESPSASGARGFARGQFFTKDGRLVASTSQESLMRLL